MVDQLSIQTISILVSTIGMIVALTYYALTIRNQNKIRQIQILMDVWSQWSKPEVQRNAMEVQNMEFEDFDDFMRKYDSSVNPEEASKRYALWTSLETIGYLLKLGHITSDDVWNQGGGPFLLHWLKWEPIIKEKRIRYDPPDYFSNFEYLATEIIRIREQKGLSPTPNIQ